LFHRRMRPGDVCVRHLVFPNREENVLTLRRLTRS
jgi:hypothetical protein